MAEVLEYGEDARKVVKCNACKSVIVFTDADTHAIGKPPWNYIWCPVCGGCISIDQPKVVMYYDDYMDFKSQEA